ncbi:MAG: AAA family ATPase [Planctomycetota bacterium]
MIGNGEWIDAEDDVLSDAEPRRGQREEEPIFVPISCAELAAMEFDDKYLIENMLAADTPTIVGAPLKCLKTMLSTEAAVCMATGLPFCGEWEVPEVKNVAFFCGEGGKRTLQDYAFRVTRSKDMRLETIDRLHFFERVPQFGNATHLVALEKIIDHMGFEVAFIDPAYLAITTERESSLFAQGALLRGVAESCLGHGCTPILLHHIKRSVADPKNPPQLQDLSWAGFAEFAGQWWLMSRREEYNPMEPGSHRLWFNVGGRLGHGGLWGLDIEEGRKSDPGGRIWEVDIVPPEAARTEAQAAKETERRVRREQQEQSDMIVVAMALRAFPEGATAGAVREKCSPKLSGARARAALNQLVATGNAEFCEVQVSNHKTPGKGYKPLATTGIYGEFADFQ